MSTNRENKSTRNFGMIIYPDADNYECEFVLQAAQFFFSEWAFILHDKDTLENGELKKPHYHLLCRKSTPSTISVVSNQLKIPSNYIQSVSNWKSALLYLTHAGLIDKYNYPVSEVHTNLPSSYFTNAEATSFIAYRAITEVIQSGEVRNLTQLNNWCIENGYWSEFRRSWSLFNSLLHEACYIPLVGNPRKNRCDCEIEHGIANETFNHVVDALDYFNDILEE